MDFLKELEEWYLDSLDGECPPESRLDFLADYVFDFTTYCSEMSELFGAKAVEVFRAITEKKTFEYIEDDERHKWYLIMCNMPFFANRIEWGTSIRGAWWDYAPQANVGRIEIGARWDEFCIALLEFSDK